MFILATNGHQKSSLDFEGFLAVKLMHFPKASIFQNTQPFIFTANATTTPMGEPDFAELLERPNHPDSDPG